MVTFRKQQILAKRQLAEGVAAVPTGSDARLVYEPAISDSPETTDRTPAGPSLSRAVSPVGRKSRQLTFQSDMVGSGDTTPTIDEPDWGLYLEACGYERIQPVALPLTSVSGNGYHLGEIVQKGAARAVVIGQLLSGAPTSSLASTGTLVVAPLTGAITTTGTLTGESSGTTGTIGTVADYAGVCYKPTSKKEVTCTASGGWSGADPVAGDVIVIKRAGVQVGGAQVAEINGAGTSIVVVQLDGAPQDGDTLHFGASSATIDAATEMTRTPAITFAHNLDGRWRKLTTARGDFELQADAGNQLVWSWTFNGDPATDVDGLAVATGALQTLRGPRLFGSDGAMVTYARTVDMGGSEPVLRLSTKSVTVSGGNTVPQDLDVNSAGGSRGSNVTDRAVVAGFTVHAAHSLFDWEAMRDASQTVHAGVLTGTAAGNIVGYVVPNGQVRDATPTDSEGLAAFEVTLEARRLLEQGDDEVYFFQL
jgi:hypothetical protein